MEHMPEIRASMSSAAHALIRFTTLSRVRTRSNRRGGCSGGRGAVLTVLLSDCVRVGQLSRSVSSSTHHCPLCIVAPPTREAGHASTPSRHAFTSPSCLTSAASTLSHVGFLYTSIALLTPPSARAFFFPVPELRDIRLDTACLILSSPFRITLAATCPLSPPKPCQHFNRASKTSNFTCDLFKHFSDLLNLH